MSVFWTVQNLDSKVSYKAKRYIYLRRSNQREGREGERKKKVVAVGGRSVDEGESMREGD